MDTKLGISDVKSVFPTAYQKLISWYDRKEGQQSPDDGTRETMFTTLFAYDDITDLLRQFLKDEGVLIKTYGGPSLGYGYCFQENCIPEYFDYPSDSNALYAGVYVALGQVNR